MPRSSLVRRECLLFPLLAVVACDAVIFHSYREPYDLLPKATYVLCLGPSGSRAPSWKTRKLYFTTWHLDIR